MHFYKNIQHNFYIFKHFFKINLRNYVEYNINFLFSLISLIASIFFYTFFGKIVLIDTIHANYSLTSIVAYYILILSFKYSIFTLNNYIRDIMSGKIIIYITKNISLWKYIFFDYIAKITTNKIILFGILSVMGSYFFKLNMLFAFLFWFLGLIMFTLFGIIFIFSSFWFGNISPITTVIYFIITFSSGIVIPLDIYPLWLQKIIYILPFQYFLYVPTKIALGNIKITFHLFAIYLIWLLLLFILVKIIEIKGLQRYEQLGG